VMQMRRPSTGFAHQQGLLASLPCTTLPIDRQSPFWFDLCSQPIDLACSMFQLINVHACSVPHVSCARCEPLACSSALLGRQRQKTARRRSSAVGCMCVRRLMSSHALCCC
jgi:hypothetical protein